MRGVWTWRGRVVSVFAVAAACVCAASPSVAEAGAEKRSLEQGVPISSEFLTNGGQINVLGTPARLALTDRLGVFVSKARYARAGFDELLPEADGALNVAFGAKYVVWSSPRNSTLIAGGLRYEASSSGIRSGQVGLQGGGKGGLLDPFLTMGVRSARAEIQTGAGFNCSLAGDHDSTAFHWGLGFDYEIFKRLFAVAEANLLTTISEGPRMPSAVLGSFEGYDFSNFGNDDSGTAITAGAGARYRVNDHLIVGGGFEVPMPGRDDLIGFRLLVDVTARL